MQLKSKSESNNTIVASPLNYIGGKAKLLPQMKSYFPDDIQTFYDVFAGGGNVSININAKNFVINDINEKVIEVLRTLYNMEVNEFITKVLGYIQDFSLSKHNKDEFIKFRKYYNQNPCPIKLYTLVCFSFNYQFRFNSNHEFNNPFGKNRSHFSDSLREKLIRFTIKMQKKNIQFMSLPFEELLALFAINKNDFVYCDPPYLITTGSYNDGNRGFKDWTSKQEILLLEKLDMLNENGIKFALSNVLSHKGKVNELLIDWSKNYTIVPISSSYRNSSYQTRREDSEEVLIVNYKI